MPEAPPTPEKRRIRDPGSFTPNPPAPFVELGLVSNFSFLRGASDPVDLVLTAHLLGYDAIGIADRNTMAGTVRVHGEAATVGLRPVIGCRLDLLDAPSLLAYPKTRTGYGQLCALLSAGKMQDAAGGWQRKGRCDLSLAMVADACARAPGEIVLIAMPEGSIDAFAAEVPRLVAQLPDLTHLAAAYLYRGDDRARINHLARLAAAHGLRLLATNDVHYHTPARRPLQDVMTCIREKVTILTAGHRLYPNAERHLKTPAEMQRLFADWPDAIRQSRSIADACTFSLSELSYEYPEETVPHGRTPDEQLRLLTWEGAAERYPDGVPADVARTLEKELALMAKMNIARYFLTIRDIVDFARGKGILCQGRGSAANSAVCYCLKITNVDPAQHQLLFERFISEERKEPPDIDVDFEHERREEVIQHIYQRYGRDRAGLCATVIHYRPRMAIREVGKVMGLSEDVTTPLARPASAACARPASPDWKGAVATETGAPATDMVTVAFDAGEPRQQTLDRDPTLHPCQRIAKTDMRAGAECQVAVLPTTDIQVVRVREDRRVSIASADPQVDHRPRGQRLLPDGGFHRHPPVAELVGTLEAQEFLQRRFHQVRIVAQPLHLFREGQQSRHAIADQVGCRLVPGVQQEDAVLDQLLLRQCLAIDFAADQSRKDVVVTQCLPPLIDQVLQVGREVLDRQVAPFQVIIADHRFQRAEDRHRPVPQAVAVRHRHTQHVADDPDRQGKGEIADQVDLSPLCRLVEKSIHHGDDRRLHLAHGARRERFRQDLAHPRVQWWIIEHQAGRVVPIQTAVAELRPELPRLVRRHAAVLVDSKHVGMAAEEHRTIGHPVDRAVTAQGVIDGKRILQKGRSQAVEVESPRRFLGCDLHHHPIAPESRHRPAVRYR